jgi:ribokinase
MTTPEQAARIVAIGDLTVDLIFSSVPALPAWGREVEATALDVRLGGNLGNLAAAAAQLPLAITCVGPIGGDDWGAKVIAELEGIGASTEFVRVEASRGTSVTAAFTRADGERAFVTYPGVLGELLTDLEAAADCPGDMAFLTGWCQPPRIAVEALAAALRTFKRQGRRVVLDLAWSDETWARFGEWGSALELVDDLLLNEDELRAATGASGVEDGVEALHALAGGGVSAIVVKRGAAGAYCRGPAGQAGHLPGLRVDVANAVGAGDAFNAGYLYASTVLGRSLLDAVEFAVVFSGLVLAGRGSVPVTAERVLEALAQRAARSS